MGMKRVTRPSLYVDKKTVILSPLDLRYPALADNYRCDENTLVENILSQPLKILL
jgi:hypothetical protein